VSIVPPELSELIRLIAGSRPLRSDRSCRVKCPQRTGAAVVPTHWSPERAPAEALCLAQRPQRRSKIGATNSCSTSGRQSPITTCRSERRHHDARRHQLPPTNRARRQAPMFLGLHSCDHPLSKTTPTPHQQIDMEIHQRRQHESELRLTYEGGSPLRPKNRGTTHPTDVSRRRAGMVRWWSVSKNHTLLVRRGDHSCT